jgi:hypothetical protein
LHIHRTRCRAHDRAIAMLTAPAQKEVGYFSAMPADGMTAAH